MIIFIMRNQEFLQLESGLGYKLFQIGINLVDQELQVESGERGTQKKIIIKETYQDTHRLAMPCQYCLPKQLVIILKES